MIGAILTIIQDEARRIWCHRWLGLACASAILAAGLAYVFALPQVYDAWGQVYVDKLTPVTEATRGVSLVGENFGSANVVEKTLLNDQNLEKLIRQTDPYAARMTRPELARAVLQMRSRIKVTSDDEGFVEFHYLDTDPVNAAGMARRLLDQFITTNVNRSRNELTRAAEFLDDQIAAHKALLTESETRIETLRRTHPSLAALPSSRAETDPQEVLVNAPPAVRALAPPKPSAAAERVASLEARLEQLRTVYTDQYPDVVSVRRQLADAIAAQAAEPAEPAAFAASGAPVRRVIRRAPRPQLPPAVVADWADAQRNAEIVRTNYQQLITKREAARMSLAIFGSDASGKFQVTRAPTAPVAPAGPRRLLYSALVVVAAIGGGLAAAYMRGAIRGIMVSPRELELACQLPVIGTVSWEPAWSTANRGRSLEPPRLAAPSRRPALGWLRSGRSAGQSR